jgi:hypothetical protein
LARYQLNIRLICWLVWVKIIKISSLIQTLFFLLTLLTSVSFSCFAGELPSDKKQGDAQNALDEKKVKSIFISKLLQTANSGKLFDPIEISRILNLDFQTQKIVWDTDCKSPYSQLTEITTSTTSTDSWYRIQPSATFFYTAFPTIQYQVVREKRCYDNPVRSQLTDRTHAWLSFNALGNFSCISEDDIKKLIPNIKRESKNYFSSDALINNDIGTHINFSFSKDWCAISVSIVQDAEFGWKYSRAEQKYTDCKTKAKQKYCASQPNATWGELYEHANKACDIFNNFYIKEPNQTHPPLDMAPKIFQVAKIPCETK